MGIMRANKFLPGFLFFLVCLRSKKLFRFSNIKIIKNKVNNIFKILILVIFIDFNSLFVQNWVPFSRHLMFEMIQGVYY